MVQSDAKFLYSLIDIQENVKNIKSNYMLMSLPYIGIFADGAEQWCKKVGLKNFKESDQYFYGVHSLLEKIKGYYNISVDYCGKEACGKTILCVIYVPLKTLGVKSYELILKDLSIFAGKLVAFFLYPNLKPYNYNKKIIVKYKDYHFYKNCPIKLKSDLGFVLFNILRNINYVIEFIDKFFVEEIPQKFKFAYL